MIGYECFAFIILCEYFVLIALLFWVFFFYILSFDYYSYSLFLECIGFYKSNDVVDMNQLLTTISNYKEDCSYHESSY